MRTDSDSITVVMDDGTRITPGTVLQVTTDLAPILGPQWLTRPKGTHLIVEGYTESGFHLNVTNTRTGFRERIFITAKLFDQDLRVVGWYLPPEAKTQFVSDPKWALRRTWMDDDPDAQCGPPPQWVETVDPGKFL